MGNQWADKYADLGAQLIPPTSEQVQQTERMHSLARYTQLRLAQSDLIQSEHRKGNPRAIPPESDKPPPIPQPNALHHLARLHDLGHSLVTTSNRRGSLVRCILCSNSCPRRRLANWTTRCLSSAPHSAAAYRHRRASRPRHDQDEPSPFSLPSITSPMPVDSLPQRLVDAQLELMLAPPSPQMLAGLDSPSGPSSSDSGLSLDSYPNLTPQLPGLPPRLIEAQVDLMLELPSPHMFAGDDSRSSDSSTEPCPSPLLAPPSPTAAIAARHHRSRSPVTRAPGTFTVPHSIIPLSPPPE